MGLLYYVMPYVEGESLRARLAREGPLSMEEALHVVRQVADALEYAHGHGVVHCDIKPGNIMLHAGHAVVTDFGIARAMAAAGKDALEELGFVQGTPCGSALDPDLECEAWPERGRVLEVAGMPHAVRGVLRRSLAETSRPTGSDRLQSSPELSYSGGHDRRIAPGAHDVGHRTRRTPGHVEGRTGGAGGAA